MTSQGRIQTKTKGAGLQVVHPIKGGLGHAAHYILKKNKAFWGYAGGGGGLTDTQNSPLLLYFSYLSISVLPLVNCTVYRPNL